MSNVLKGGTFNLRYGRPDDVVKGEVARLLFKHDLDFLCVQEANDYFKILPEIKGYKYFATNAYPGGKESGILVKAELKTGKPAYDSYGDGFFNADGHHHAPLTFPRVTIDGWLRVGSIHLPVPSVWVNGVLDLPPRRLDDYLALAKKIYRFFRWSHGQARLIAGDWNEPLSTKGKWAPGWIADKSGAEGKTTESKAGHGRIDYPIYKNCYVRNVRKDLEIAEGSDHEPVIFVVVKR